MSNTLVFGFYGIVNSKDINYVFGDNATRLEFKSLRVKTYTGVWPVVEKPADYLGISESQLEHLHLQFFKSASRFKVYDGIDLCTVDNHFYNLLYYTQQLLINSEVKSVIFNNPPHATLEVMVYEYSRIKGIDTIILMQNIFPACFFAMKSIGDSGVYLKSDFRYTLPDEYLNYSQEPLDLPYMKNIEIPLVNIYHIILRNLIKSIHWRPFRRARYGRSLTTLISDFSLYRDWKRAKSRRKFAIEELPEKFVYVPLHFQPEATTQSIGGEYYNQMHMIRELRALLPNDIDIVIKENPIQGIDGRGLGFYDMLEKMSDVKFVKDDTPGLALIRNAIATATITGTAGWEALRMKKPVICFGHAWYSGVYGAFRASAGVIEQVLSFVPDEDRFRASVEKLSDLMFEGFVANGFQGNRPDLGYQKNLDCLKRGVEFLVTGVKPQAASTITFK